MPADSKSDNFKVGDQKPREIDTRFFDDANGTGHTSADESWLLGRSIRWTDPLGASNIKWSDLAPELMVNHEAHVEAVEAGTHHITVADQPGCTVGDVWLDGQMLSQSGPQTVPVGINRSKRGADDLHRRRVHLMRRGGGAPRRTGGSGRRRVALTHRTAVRGSAVRWTRTRRRAGLARGSGLARGLARRSGLA